MCSTLWLGSSWKRLQSNTRTASSLEVVKHREDLKWLGMPLTCPHSLSAWMKIMTNFFTKDWIISNHFYDEWKMTLVLPPPLEISIHFICSAFMASLRLTSFEIKHSSLHCCCLFLASRTLTGALLAHVEAPVTHLGGLVEEQRRVGLVTVLQVGNSCSGTSSVQIDLE